MRSVLFANALGGAAGVVGGVAALAIIAVVLASWLVMRKRRIRNSGSSDEESPHAKGMVFGSSKRFPGANTQAHVPSPIKKSTAKAGQHRLCAQEETQRHCGAQELPLQSEDVHIAHITAGPSMDGGVVKDSASSTMSGEIGMQPYIRRSGTDDSGYVLLDTTLVFLFCICSCIFLRQISPS